MGILLLNSDSGKMRVLIIVAAFVALAAAGEKKAAKSGKGYSYNGRYAGKCGNDGFYYNDANSFVICSNGNAYYQPCAPGSKNKGHSHYTHGGKYGVADFCGVNLVDYGYGAHKGGYGHSHGHSHGNRGHSVGHSTSYSHTSHGTHGSHGNRGHSHGHSGYGVQNSYGSHGHNAGYGSHGHSAGYGTHGHNAGYGSRGHRSYGHAAVSHGSYGQTAGYGTSHGHSHGHRGHRGATVHRSTSYQTSHS